MSIDHDRVPLPAMLTDADVERVLRVSMPTLRRKRSSEAVFRLGSMCADLA
jgi:hypothetical protein